MADRNTSPDNGFADTSVFGRRLRSVRFVGTLSLFWERVAPAILPLAIVIALFSALSWFGVFRMVPDAWRMALGVVFAVAGLAALWPLRAIRWPSRDSVDRRIETDNMLRHQPITAQDDQLATGDDPFAAALWQVHRKRLAEQVGRVGGTTIRTDIPRRDPWALRAIVPMLLATGFAFSFGQSGGSLGDVLRSHSGVEVAPARIDAWISPPAYTGVAPIFLTAAANAGRDAFTVPEGSTVTVRIAGGDGSTAVKYPDDATQVAATDADGVVTIAANAAREFSFPVSAANGILSIGSSTDSEAQQSWSIAMTDDLPPTIELDGDIERAANGTLTLKYKTSDDYRVAKARGIITLAEDAAKGARPLYEAPELPLTLPRKGSDEGKTVRDLSTHPWAGARITLVLEAEDDLGQTGRSQPIATVLPGKPFSNPLARALVEQRRNLALDANAKRDVVDVFDIFMLYPEETINNASHFLGISTAQSRLKQAQTDDALRAAADYIWEVALNIESGNLSAAEQRMKQAQQALKEALERGASDEEIDQLMAELRQAMQEFLREFAQQQQNNPNNQQQNQQNAQQMDQQSLDEMLKQIEEMAKSGARQQAMDMLSQLEDMMNNLQMGQHRQQQGDGQSQAQQQMNELGEIMRQQQEMMNETFRENRRGEGEGREQRRGSNPGQQPGEQGQNQGDEPGQQGQGEGQQGEGQQGQNGQQGQGQGLEGLAPGQQALRERLDNFMEGLKGMGIDPGEDFGDAGQSMDQAGDSLGQGEGDQALNDQGNAMDALRRGANSMMQQMQQAMEGSMGGSEPGGTQNSGDRDPLGRPQRSAGPDFGDSVKVPDEIDVRRAREILDAIRKRLGNALSPQLEKEYLERLLDLN